MNLDPVLIRYMLVGAGCAAAFAFALLLVLVPFGWIGTVLILGAAIGAGVYTLTQTTLLD